MRPSDRRPRRRRTSTLVALALAVVVADAAVLWAGLGHGLVGVVIAFCLVLATQRWADAVWRSHVAADAENAVQTHDPSP
ncbi:hypothetical protein [Nocardioides rubriscoriae]|uniref:hypothetical protein n=1 Tax=Nocardioides rubriscoriae TaxID=642762 RepID=UPI0011E03834|nr:hypothetical protein [Nocardioides rubriscoriae]